MSLVMILSGPVAGAEGIEKSAGETESEGAGSEQDTTGAESEVAEGTEAATEQGSETGDLEKTAAESETATEQGPETSDSVTNAAEAVAETATEAESETLTEAGPESGVNLADDEWLIDHNMTINEDGMYEEVGADGEVYIYDPEDPEFWKYFKERTEEEIGLSEIAGEEGVDLMSVYGETSDPYTCTLTGYQYKYPSYIKNNSDTLPPVRYGMDISKYQKSISVASFREMKEQYGIEFVFVRAGFRGYGTSGSLNKDDYFGSNIKNASNAGLYTGVYFFSQAISEDEGAEEAEYCNSLISGYRDYINLPVVIDFEYAWNSDGTAGRMKAADLSASAQTGIVNAFCEKISSYGYMPGVYANKSMLESDMKVTSIPAANYIWMANFVKPSDGVCKTSYSSRLEAWQFTDAFTGFGTKGKNYMGNDVLDLDFWYGYFPGEEVEVTFDYMDGNSEAVLVKAGTKLAEPDTPTREEYVFGGWYRDEEFTQKWDFRKDTVSWALTLYALWNEPSKIPVSKLKVGAIKTQQLYYDEDGNPLARPEISVFYDNERLEDGDDGEYDVEYVNNTAPGTGSVIITGKGRFSGSRKVDFKISASPLSKAKVSFSRTDLSFIYTGNEIEPLSKRDSSSDLSEELNASLTISQKNAVTGETETETLKEGRDYVISYTNNVNAGKKATIIFTGSGIYTGTLKKTFAITQVPFTVGTVQNDNINVTVSDLVSYTKGGAKPKVTIEYETDDGPLTLSEGVDYTLKFSNNTKVNTNPLKKPSVTITGKGNFKGKLTENFDIAPADIGSATAFAEDIVFKNKANICKPRITITDVNGKNLSAGTEYDKNIEYSYVENGETVPVDRTTVVPLGATVTATIRGKGNYEGTAVATFRFVSRSISTASVKVANKTFEGDEVTLTQDDFTYVRVAGIYLSDDDYEILPGTYVNNTKAGTAKVTIRGLGDYGGTKVVSFKIVKNSIQK